MRTIESPCDVPPTINSHAQTTGCLAEGACLFGDCSCLIEFICLCPKFCKCLNPVPPLAYPSPLLPNHIATRSSTHTHTHTHERFDFVWAFLCHCKISSIRLDYLHVGPLHPTTLGNPLSYPFPFFDSFFIFCDSALLLSSAFPLSLSLSVIMYVTARATIRRTRAPSKRERSLSRGGELGLSRCRSPEK